MTRLTRRSLLALSAGLIEARAFGATPPLAADAQGKPDFFSPEFWQLMLVYRHTDIEFAKLRNISFAQWALETGYGKGDPKRAGSDLLPRIHKNFAGMKFRPEMAPYATSVVYTDWQRKTGNYCHFDSYENFINAYWKRLDVVENYKGWRRHTATPNAFLNFIGPIWAPSNAGNVAYESNVRGVLTRLQPGGYLPDAG